MRRELFFWKTSFVLIMFTSKRNFSCPTPSLWGGINHSKCVYVYITIINTEPITIYGFTDYSFQLIFASHQLQMNLEKVRISWRNISLLFTMFKSSINITVFFVSSWFSYLFIIRSFLCLPDFFHITNSIWCPPFWTISPWSGVVTIF